MRSYNTLRGRLFAIDRELEKRDLESDITTFSEAFGRRRRRKTKTKEQQQQLGMQVAAEAAKKAQEKQKAAEASNVKQHVNDALGAAGNAVKQVVDTALGTTAPTPSQETPQKPKYTFPALTSDTILEQLETQTKALENMVQKMRPAVRLLEEWEEDDEIDLIRPKLNAIIGAIHRFKTILETV